MVAFPLGEDKREVTLGSGPVLSGSPTYEWRRVAIGNAHGTGNMLAGFPQLVAGRRDGTGEGKRIGRQLDWHQEILNMAIYVHGRHFFLGAAARMVVHTDANIYTHAPAHAHTCIYLIYLYINV